jgi:hypothetical protein
MIEGILFLGCLMVLIYLANKAIEIDKKDD